jgi:hypothetical protein
MCWVDSDGGGAQLATHSPPLHTPCVMSQWSDAMGVSVKSGDSPNSMMNTSAAVMPR